MIFTPYSEGHRQEAGIHQYEADGSKTNMNTVFFLNPISSILLFQAAK